MRGGKGDGRDAAAPNPNPGNTPPTPGLKQRVRSGASQVAVHGTHQAGVFLCPRGVMLCTAAIVKLCDGKDSEQCPDLLVPWKGPGAEPLCTCMPECVIAG